MKQPVAGIDTRKITVNLPAQWLDEEMAATGLGVTETLRKLLEDQRRARAQRKIAAREGKVTFSITHQQLKAERE
jgi:hypothetical protein